MTGDQLLQWCLFLFGLWGVDGRRRARGTKKRVIQSLKALCKISQQLADSVAPKLT